MPTQHTDRTVAARRLIPGDMIDLHELPFPIRNEADQAAAEYELAVVEEVDRENEPPGRIGIYTSQGGYALPERHPFTWHANVMRPKERDPRPDGPLPFELP